MRQKSGTGNTIMTFAADRGLDLRLEHRAVPHGRYLDVSFEDGTAARIILDQGFGAWSPPKESRPRHGFGFDADLQADALTAIRTKVQRNRPGATYIVAMKVNRGPVSVPAGE